MQLGRPIICGAGAPNEPNDVADLRRRVGAGLRAATLNLLSGDEAHRVLSVSSVLAEVLDTFRPLHNPIHCWPIRFASLTASPISFPGYRLSNSRSRIE